MECESNDFKQIIKPLKQHRSKVVRDAIETMVKITRNAITSNDDKFKLIKLKNRAFCDKVWKYNSCQQLLLAAGWVRDRDEHNEEVIRLARSDLLPEFLQFLIDERVTKPDDEECDELKQDTLSEEISEAERKRLAAIAENRAKYEKMKEEKKEQMKLAEQIKKELRSDREYRNIRAPKTDEQLLSERERTRDMHM
ncbi:uncharacterized protein B4U79_17531 [Dinothrombium tinctorium]|uniref:PUB domain-containing protein n=1 Tax=Dinothrombium tinctorium TaxID=1965070 RepID=A0A3S3P3M2_9ACAR|nr:uncharacterized protein B4U79_17532 [Dinothrombium tinctorium]RWS11385.1 uncharacterized protein B4U79_17531 [Dinothrombium tinctorium]